MGDEVRCRVKVGRQFVEGKALLESNEIVFRSNDLRLKIPFATIREVDPEDGRLTIVHRAGTAIFDLGPKAPKWAEKIRNPRSLIDKLGVKPDHRVVVLGVRDADFTAQLEARASDISTRLRKDADVIFVGAESLVALDRLVQLRDAIKRDGMIWTITPKGKGGIRDTDVMASGKAAGLVDVKVAAFSATHSATKFVIPKAQR